GDPSVVVGVVDTGVDSTHPDLAANIWTNPREIPNNGRDDDGNGFVDDVHGWDFVDGDNAPADVTLAGGNPGHGTHVSGTIAARGNDGPGLNSGVAGVTWSSTILPVRVLDQNRSGTLAVDIAAPGVSIWSTIPGGWRSLSGTSMATPHVAGVAALVLARDPALTTAQLRQALLQGVDHKDSLAGEVASGGRLNALGALTAADAIARPPAPAAPPAPPPPAPAPAPAATAPATPTIFTPAPDRVAPQLTLTFPAKARLSSAVRRGLRALTGCNEACTLSFRLMLDARSARRLHVRRT